MAPRKASPICANEADEFPEREHLRPHRMQLELERGDNAEIGLVVIAGTANTVYELCLHFSFQFT